MDFTWTGGAGGCAAGESETRSTQSPIVTSPLTQRAATRTCPVATAETSTTTSSPGTCADCPINTGSRPPIRSIPLCVKWVFEGASGRVERPGDRRPRAGVALVLGPGVTDPKCRVPGFRRPRWIEVSSLIVLPGLSVSSVVAQVR